MMFFIEKDSPEDQIGERKKIKRYASHAPITYCTRKKAEFCQKLLSSQLRHNSFTNCGAIMTINGGIM